MSKELRYQVVQLYKQLMYMARDYPSGEDYFKQKLRLAFRNKKGITDETQIREALKHGNFVKKELETLYYLKKYRAMKKRYYNNIRILNQTFTMRLAFA
ncbi:LYR motif containing protein 5 [Trichuris trichiura]|uniref:LYR motif containing protein 5 n=1 Tax=Trichuris trichiura TaxID=36087 RepID=A0A077Z775_TRITR|nr:LYR motif containing protein 5 [Trichuris trichiura]